MKNSIVDGPRVMLPGEYDELLELIEVSYGLTRTHYLNHFPKAKKENIIFENHFIIKERGRLVSHVALYPMQAVACEANIKVGGIGDIKIPLALFASFLPRSWSQSFLVDRVTPRKPGDYVQGILRDQQ